MNGGRLWALVALQLAVLACVAQAQSARHVDVPEGCGSEEGLSERLRQSGAQPPSESAPVDLVIAQLPSRDYELQLSWSGEHRTLRDSQCIALFDSAVVILATAMTAGPSPTTAPPPPPVESSTPPASIREPARDIPNEHSLIVGVGVLAGIGTLPKLAPGAELALLASSGRFGAGFDLHASMPNARDATGGHGVEVLGLGTRLLAMFAAHPALHFRAGPSLTLLLAHGTGASVRTNSGTGVRPGLSLEAAGRLRLGGRFSSELALSADLAMLRPRFRIAGFDTVFREPQWSAGLRLRIFHEFL